MHNCLYNAQGEFHCQQVKKSVQNMEHFYIDDCDKNNPSIKNARKEFNNAGKTLSMGENCKTVCENIKTKHNIKCNRFVGDAIYTYDKKKDKDKQTKCWCSGYLKP